MRRRVLALAAGVWRRTPAAIRASIVRGTQARFPIGVVGVIHDNEGRILVLEHRFRVEAPWGLPGGFLRARETPAEGLARELREETGLEVAVHPAIWETHFASEARSEPKASEDGWGRLRRTGTRWFHSRAGFATLVLRGRGEGPLTFSAEIVGGGFFGPEEIPASTHPLHLAIARRWAARPIENPSRAT